MIMAPRLRKFALTVHLALSVSWIGSVAAYIVLDLTAATSHDPQTLRAVWISMGLVVVGAIVPLALSSLLTGLIMALGTRWGLLQHWWVLISFLLTVGATMVLLVEVGTISRGAAIAADPDSTVGELRTLGSTLPHSVGGLLVLLLVLVLNMYKPPGLTARGRRKRGQASTTRPEAEATVPNAVTSPAPDGLQPDAASNPDDSA